MFRFGCFAVILTVYSYSVETAHIPCNVEALKWTDELRESFQRRVFWTSIGLYRSDIVHGNIVTGFVVGTILKRSHFWMNDDNAIVYAYHLLDDIHGAQPNDVLLQKIDLFVDEEKAIFQYTRSIITWHTAKEEYSYIRRTQTSSNQVGDITFALVHEEENGLFRIYRNCDGRRAWVQVEDSALKRYLNKGKNPSTDMLSTLTKLQRMMRRKLDEMNIIQDTELQPMIRRKLKEMNIIHDNELDVLNAWSQEELLKSFNQVDMAAQFIELSS